MNPQDCFDALDAAGPLAAHIPGFQARISQQELSARIAQALNDDARFIADCATGTGKTFAYLVPSLLSGKKVLISTGTKHLQDQLFERDLPLVRAALGVPVAVALLKGRANYLCLHRLDHAQDFETGDRGAAELHYIKRWSQETTSGDFAELIALAEDSVWRTHLSSTGDNCLGGQCRHFDACFVNRNRRAALQADVLVVNHHLFFADMSLRGDGWGQILPSVDALIFDEAHQLPDIATQFFGVSVSSHQLIELIRDAIRAETRECSGLTQLRTAETALEHAINQVRLLARAKPKRDDVPERTRELFHSDSPAPFRAAIAAVAQTLGVFADALELAGAAGPELAHCAARASQLLDRLHLFIDAAADRLRWFEHTTRGFAVHLTPLDIAHPFQQQLERFSGACIFTSATLAVAGRFHHFQERLGLSDAETACWDSPFDYARQALLYLPRDLPDPGAADYTARIQEAVLPVLAASGGRAFFLFTSHRALQDAAARWRGRLAFPLLIQGEAPRGELLARFRALGNAVLLGTGSFWEGVDVRGEALSCVIIDKLPFASPEDPIVKARGAALEQQGRNAFGEFQLPEAVIALKQGAGRLIRDVNDRGVLVLCDPRLTQRPYGKVFLASLPPLPRTRELADVQAFFRRAATGDSTDVACAPRA